ncbi:MAG: acylphosphatase [Methanotrichaceae archaeon]|nr:acylphosphatase [Methanotrichaceae archaeon]
MPEIFNDPYPHNSAKNHRKPTWAMTESIVVTIAGARVWDVGYRPFLLMKAIGVGIRKVFAYNLDVDGGQAVMVQVSGESDALDRFVQLARSCHPVHAQVSTIEVRDFEGDVLDAFQFLKILQFEHIYKGIPAILNIEKLQVEMLGNQDMMLEMQEETVEKQDTTIGIQGNIKEDISCIKENIAAIEGSIEGGAGRGWR